jgi:tetratricopeptide (TPR) repeat protein
MSEINEAIFMEIANEIKGLHNGAIVHIKAGEYAEAAIQYRKALMITDKIKYYEGTAITLFSMANLAVMVGDLIEALHNAADSKEMFKKAGLPGDSSKELLLSIAKAVKKKGIELEKKGKFHEAIEHFEACIPYSDEKGKNAMLHEIKLLERIIYDRK